MNFTETETAYINALDSLDAVKSVFKRYNLGSGFTLTVVAKVTGKKIKITREFNGRGTVRKIPESVIKKYATAIDLLDQWEADLLADFPDLERL